MLMSAVELRQVVELEANQLILLNKIFEFLKQLISNIEHMKQLITNVQHLADLLNPRIAFDIYTNVSNSI